MNWIEVCIETKSSEDGLPVELITAMLMDIGIAGIEIEDNYDTRLFLEHNKESWDYADEELLSAQPDKAIVRFYLEESFEAKKLDLVRTGLKGLSTGEFAEWMGSLKMDVKTVDDADWIDNWKRYYKPFRVGRRFVVRPVWEEYETKENDVVLSLNPGQVFGTGLHQTTRMCLEALEKHVFPGARVLDLGCGSGILAIAALLLGAGAAVALDTDKAAEQVVRENTSFNNISGDKLRIYIGNVLNDNALYEIINDKYDIILANIVADVVIEMTPIVSRLLANGGWFVSSGIIKGRLAQVLSCIEEAGLNVCEITQNEGDEWVAVAARL